MNLKRSADMASIAESNGHKQLDLEILDLSHGHKFIKPVKRINEGQDVNQFLVSQAYRDICIFIMQLNIAMCPRIIEGDSKKIVKQWRLGDESIKAEGLVVKVQQMLERIKAMISEVPPDTGPRRFGNISFRRWHELLEQRVVEIMMEFIPHEILDSGKENDDGDSSQDELASYLLGSFGSGSRLDFGTGHELNFLAFLGCLWKLGGFKQEGGIDGSVERSIVIGVIEPYLNVIRKLVLEYTLEPAGSHGVWGLDDHFFISYIFGSAQYSPAIRDGEAMPTEGSLDDVPTPADVTKRNTVDRERKTNMYFAAIGFIYDVKTGPFWEHSPILFDISGIKSGWGKVNKGMIKMYNAEVLSKFPVVQHFYFGSLFSWDQDPTAKAVSTNVHLASQPMSTNISVTGDTGGAPTGRSANEGTRAPWATAIDPRGAPPPMNSGPPFTLKPSSAKDPKIRAPRASEAPTQSLTGMPITKAPWAQGTIVDGSGPSRIASGMPATRAPWANSGGDKSPQEGTQPMRAPWAQGTVGGGSGRSQMASGMPATRAPWAHSPGDNSREADLQPSRSPWTSENKKQNLPPR